MAQTQSQLMLQQMLFWFCLIYFIVNLNGQKVGLQEYLYQTFFVPYFSPVNASLAGAITFVLILMIPMLILYKKKIFIKV